MKKNIKLPKYASILSDAGFKAVLMAPRNKNLLKKLLNLVLPPDRQIDEIVSYEDREINGMTPFSKYSRIDIRCKDTLGRHFIVEMQRQPHDFFFQRCVWYGSNVYGSSLEIGQDYTELKPVYVIAFLEYELPHDDAKWDKGKCVSCYQMTENSTGEFAPDTIMCIFVELGRFIKGMHELDDSFDKACYVIKNSSKWESSAPAALLDDELSTELVNACEVENFPADTKTKYIESMYTEMDYKAEMQANFRIGKEEGLAEGKAKGKAEGLAEGEAKGLTAGKAEKARESAINLIAAGVPFETIASCIGLTLDEVKALAQEA